MTRSRYDLCGRDRNQGEASQAAEGERGISWLTEVENALSADTITIPREHANQLAAAPHPQLEPRAVGGALNGYRECMLPILLRCLRRISGSVPSLSNQADCLFLVACLMWR